MNPKLKRAWLIAGKILLGLLAAFLCLVLLAAAIYWRESRRGRADWLAYERDAKARGVQLDFASFIPPEIPDAENFAAIPLFNDAFRASELHEEIPNPFKLPASADMPKLDDPVRQHTINLAEWQQFFLKSKVLDVAGANPAADVLKALEKNREPLAQLEAATARPHCRFPVHWERHFEAASPHLFILMSASKLFGLSLSAHLALGESASAYRDFQAGWRLATVIQKEPMLLAGLVRAAIASTIENAVWGGLVNHQLADAELQKIAADLGVVDWLADYRFSMNSERAEFNATTDLFIRHPSRLVEVPAMAGFREARPSDRALLLYPGDWLYFSKVRSSEYYDELLARVEPAEHRLFTDRPLAHSPENIKTMREKVRYLLFAFGGSISTNLEKRFASTTTFTDEARIACGLERFRLARGAYPSSLAELAPDFIASIPHDIVNGEPYRYHRADDGAFQLYSVGLNLRDDGGALDPKKTPANQLDWVWPATAKTPGAN